MLENFFPQCGHRALRGYKVYCFRFHAMIWQGSEGRNGRDKKVEEMKRVGCERRGHLDAGFGEVRLAHVPPDLMVGLFPGDLSDLSAQNSTLNFNDPFSDPSSFIMWQQPSHGVRFFILFSHPQRQDR